jgi:regulator of protease activity HflC (stomatin/prohibitin superfamily)
LVDQLEKVLNQGWRVPLTASLIVNADECLRLIDQMRISVPSSVKESERMIAERDQILENARARADSMIADAQEQAQEIVSERGISITAERQAEQLLIDSRAEANRMVQQAEDYVADVLQRLSEQLETMLRQAENGIQAIEEARQGAETASFSMDDEYSRG